MLTLKTTVYCTRTKSLHGRSSPATRRKETRSSLVTKATFLCYVRPSARSEISIPDGSLPVVFVLIMYVCA